MKRALFAVAVVAGLAYASELRVAIVRGANIQTFTGAPGGKYSVQCLSVDGGTDQKVYFRPGCNTRPDAGVQCVVDAGQGDGVMNFDPATGGSSDPYKVDLAPNEDRIHFAAVAGYAIPIYCSVFRRAP